MPNVDPRILTIEVTDDEITHLVDGRTISVPLVWSWRLVDAAPEQRQHWGFLVAGRVCAGRTLTRISAWKACGTGCGPIIQEDPQNRKSETKRSAGLANLMARQKKRCPHSWAATQCRVQSQAMSSMAAFTFSFPPTFV